ncbi:MAG: PAS domain S-box protein [Thermodesulfovibrionales bacterium]
MKKKIILWLSLFSMIFLIWGGYIIYTVEQATNTLDKLVTLHKVEIMREDLSIRIRKVQTDLSLRNTHFSRDVFLIMKNVRNMADAANGCFMCHHEEAVVERLTNIQHQIEQYKIAISRILTLRAYPERTKAVQDTALLIGEQLALNVDNMLEFTSNRLQDRTHSGLAQIDNTKKHLFVLIVAWPLLAGVLVLIFVGGITRPVSKLINAIRTIKSGDLNYRVDGLHDEFGELASAFNEMAASLKDHISRIEDSEKRYRQLFESAGDAIFILTADGDNSGQIIAANRAATEMHGYSASELVTMNIRDLNPPDTVPEVTGWIRRIQAGEWLKMELAHSRKDGSVFPVDVSAGLMESDGHKYVLAFDRDVTERKQAEEELHKSEQLKLVGELAAGLAHEIKNPLAGIKISMEVLLQELTLSEPDRHVLLMVVTEIHRIEVLIKGLLSFTKLPRPNFSLVNVNRLLDRAMELYLKSPAFESITVVRDYSPVPEIMVDPQQLQQVFLNLLLNAAEAMTGGGTLTVKTFMDAGNSTLTTEVMDTGTGMTETILKKLFQPFFTTKQRGTGLGLAITKRLIEQQGGVIAARNNPGGGSIFSVTLPTVQSEVKVHED